MAGFDDGVEALAAARCCGGPEGVGIIIAFARGRGPSGVTTGSSFARSAMGTLRLIQ